MRVMAAALVATAVSLTAGVGTPAAIAHDEERAHRCSNRATAGAWMFFTDVGHIALPTLKGDITALGTMNIDANGNVDGRFDATIGDVAFLAGVTYTGTLLVNPDCTGTLTFTTSAGSVRTDSIAVLDNGREMRGMSQDKLNLWTYTAKKLSGF
jgi:hypothetical protein